MIDTEICWSSKYLPFKNMNFNSHKFDIAKEDDLLFYILYSLNKIGLSHEILVIV